jgi:hypothetical protein
MVLMSASPSIPGGDDAYRHVRFASRLLANPTYAMADPWRLLYFWPKPVDPWFGYHVLLAPLTIFFSLVMAPKILASLIWAAIVYVIFRLLALFDSVWNVGWVVLCVCGSGTLLSRATFSRPYLLSLLLVLAAAFFTLRNRPLALAGVSAIHALSYSIFFMVGLAPGVYFLLRRDRDSAKLLAGCIAGICLGLVANPFFPENVKFDIVQTLTPAVHHNIDASDESKPITIWWIISAAPVMVVWGAAVLRTIRNRRSMTSTGMLAVLGVSIVALLMSIQVARALDYFVPFAVLFAASGLSTWIARNRRDARYLAAMLSVLCLFNVGTAYGGVAKAPSITAYRGIGEYLERHGRGAIVFNTAWDQYPFLYFWSPDSRYVNGIYPTFLYMQDERRYWLWHHLSKDGTTTCDEPQCDAANSIPTHAAARQFDASFVFVEKARTPRLEVELRRAPGFSEVYSDPKLALFSVEAAGGGSR